MEALNQVNDVIWHESVLYIVLGVGLLFTLWSMFSQYRALTHGVAVTRGKYDSPDDPGAINHFQALSAALSATVGLGNIGGVAVAIALGGPGAVFWMWMVGLVGMALKTTEVTLAMLYRNTDDPANPHGGAMWVAAKGFAEWSPSLAWFGKFVGGVFCVTLLISAVTGGNMFQAWNVSDVTLSYFGVPKLVTGVVLAVMVGAVIIGGIRRIGAVAGRLVPFMCGAYLIAAIAVLLKHFGDIPGMLALIVDSAFNPLEAEGAFIGGTAGYAILWGMKRALFSSEAGQGSSPIAHAAAKTDEPVREAVVAGLEPFIDTIIVCTLTALVILTTGTWNREAHFVPDAPPEILKVDGADNRWTLADTMIEGAEWSEGDPVYTVIKGDPNQNTGNQLHQLPGSIARNETGFYVDWNDLESAARPSFDLGVPSMKRAGIYANYTGATLTAKAFDRAYDGLGQWLVTIAAWLFALSTMISWSYYGEQGMVYLAGQKSILPYKLVYCGLVVVACIPSLVRTDQELDALTALGTGVMLWANIPIMLIFGYKAMKAYHTYFRRLKAGEFESHT